jgi:hypothetical protein
MTAFNFFPRGGLSGNYSSGNGIESLSLPGIVVSWIAQMRADGPKGRYTFFLFVQGNAS